MCIAIADVDIRLNTCQQFQKDIRIKIDSRACRNALSFFFKKNYIITWIQVTSCLAPNKRRATFGRVDKMLATV